MKKSNWFGKWMRLGPDSVESDSNDSVLLWGCRFFGFLINALWRLNLKSRGILSSCFGKKKPALRLLQMGLIGEVEFTKLDPIDMGLSIQWWWRWSSISIGFCGWFNSAAHLGSVEFQITFIWAVYDACDDLGPWYEELVSYSTWLLISV